MKKICALLLSLVMVVSLAACSGQPAGSLEPSSGTMESSAPTGSEELESTPENSGAGSTLVVYFSATGNTEAVAEYIADITGADLFELEPVEPYTDEDLNWTADGSRVNQEHDDETLRDVELTADTVENWEDYDTIFIGYPIWWGIAAWPVNDFIQSNDFAGKTVIPFCTSSSSGLGESGELLAEMAGSGEWMEGQRFSSNATEEDVRAWLEEMNLS